MKVNIEELGDGVFLVVVPEDFVHSAANMNKIAEGINAPSNSTWYVRTNGFMMHAFELEV